jgi:hypothetical protein
MWQQVCGVTREEVMSESTLWEWDGCTLVVKFYPHGAHDFTDKKRVSGKVGGKVKSPAKTQAARDNGAKHNPSTTQAEAKHNPSRTQANVRKGNVIKGKEKKSKEADASKPSTRQLSDDEWMDQTKTLYPHVNFDVELRKMDAWFSVNPTRQKTRPFVINWLNRIPAPLKTKDTTPRKADGSIDYYADAVAVFGEESVVKVAAL